METKIYSIKSDNFLFKIAILAILGFPFGLFGQPKKCMVIGVVTNYKTKLRIETKLVFEKQPNSTLTIVSHSGEMGYRASLFERGDYNCIVSAEGFVSERCSFNLLDDSLLNKEEHNIDFELIPINLNDILPFNKILFDPSSYKITNESFPELNRLLDMLISNPKIKIRLEGHTDNMSNGNKSKKLAQKRIKSIKSWLVEKGISGKRIQLKAMGAEKRLTSVDALNARKINRRVEIRVIEI